MDQSNRGYLTNEKVYNIIREQNETNKKLFKTRGIAICLMVLVVLLTLANIGASFAAAHLAKDTVVNENEEIENKATGETLSQQSTTDDIPMERTNSIAEDGTRRLCKKDKDAGEVKCNPDSFYSIDWKMCKRMVKHCKRGNTVSMSRTWPNGDQSRFQVCPFEGTMSKWRRSTLVNHVGKKFEFEQVEGMHCRLGGDAILQEKDEICSVDGDCVPGLVCVEDPDQITVCESICRRRRWVQRMEDECVENCQITTCEEADIFDD